MKNTDLRGKCEKGGKMKKDSKSHRSKTINRSEFCLASSERGDLALSELSISCVVPFGPKSLPTFPNASWEKGKSKKLCRTQKDRRDFVSSTFFQMMVMDDDDDDDGVDDDDDEWWWCWWMMTMLMIMMTMMKMIRIPVLRFYFGGKKKGKRLTTNPNFPNWPPLLSPVLPFMHHTLMQAPRPTEKGGLDQLRASHSKKFDFLLVPPTQYGVKKIMKMTVFLISKCIRLPFF